MVQTFPDTDGGWKQYRDEIDANRAQQQMRRERRWNRGQFLDFLEAYIACALWSETDDDGTPLNQSWTREHISAHAYSPMYDDCLRFVQEQHSDLYELDPAQCGRDFWLSRSGHGTGFWDRDHGDLGDRLHAAASAYGEASLYVGDDEELYYFNA